MDENALAQEIEPEVQEQEPEAQEQVQDEEQQDEQQVDGEEEKAAVDEQPDPATLQSEIDELKKKREKAEKDAKYWRDQKAVARADYFKSKQEEKKPPPAPELKEPVEEDFDDYKDYLKAHTKYVVQTAKAEWDAEASKKESDASLTEKRQAFQENLKKGFDKYDDFEDVALSPTVPITQAVADILMESDNPEDIAYYLGNNQTEAIAISRMSPVKAAKAIAKIEMSLANGETPNQNTKAKAKSKKISDAPAPIKPIGSQNKVERDPEKMTQAEFEKWRLSQGAKPY